MEVLYRNKSYKSKRKSPKDPKTGMKTRIPRTPDMEGDGIGISEQQLDPNILAVTSEEDESGLIGNCARPGTSASETDEGCTLDEGRIGQGATEEEYHTSTLNGIVLEYLELMGLEESYKTFWNECTEKRIPLPLGIREPLFQRTDFTQTDVDAFLVHFDNWEGDGLSELWKKFLEEEEEKERGKLGQVTILLRIYIASLPFRKNEDAATRASSLEELREFHQTYSEEFTNHPICLQLFAFPFVADPPLHPAFKTIFTDEWQSDLRKQLESVFTSHLESHATYGVSTCDLKQMYNHYMESPDEDIPEGSSEAGGGGGTAPAALTNEEISGKDSISTVAKLRPEICSYVKRSLDQTQERYCKLLTATAAVVNALEQAVQGKAPAIQVLEAKLQITFPEIFAPNVSGKPSEPVVAKVEEVHEAKEPEEVESQVEQMEEPDPVAEPESEEETSESETEFSDEETDLAYESKEGSEEEPQHNIKDSSTAASTMSTPRVDSLSVHVSARSSVDRLEQDDHDKEEKSYNRGGRTRRVEGGDSVSSLRLTNSKVNTRVMENSEEWAENEDHEIPDEFCQYFEGLSPSARKRVEAPLPSPENTTMKRSLLPPSVSDPFPLPPRTYEVSPRNSKILYIPSSVEVGCSTGPPTFESRASTMSSGGDRGRDEEEDQDVSSESSRSPSPNQTGRKSQPESPRWSSGGNLEINLKTVAQHLLPRQSVQETLLLGNRVLTPPPEKKGTAMACIMGVLPMSSPSTPLSSRSPNKEQWKGSVTHSPSNKQGISASYKPPRPSVSETGKPSTKTSLGYRPTTTTQSSVNTSHLRKPGFSKLHSTTKKKYFSDGQGFEYPRRIYKMDPKGHGHGGGKEDLGVLTVKPLGAHGHGPVPN